MSPYRRVLKQHETTAQQDHGGRARCVREDQSWKNGHALLGTSGCELQEISDRIVSESAQLGHHPLVNGKPDGKPNRTVTPSCRRRCDGLDEESAIAARATSDPNQSSWFDKLQYRTRELGSQELRVAKGTKDAPSRELAPWLSLGHSLGYSPGLRERSRGKSVPAGQSPDGPVSR